MGDGGGPEGLFPVFEVTGDLRMGLGCSRKGSANDERYRIVSVNLHFQGVHETVEASRHGPNALQIYGQLRPADNIQGMVENFRRRSIGHRDNDTPFGAGFTGVTPLDTSGKYYGRIEAGDFELVNMPQRPVVIAPGLEILQCAGRIGFVTFAAGQAGVQQANVEITVYGFRVAEGEVVHHGRGREALAVDGNL